MIMVDTSYSIFGMALIVPAAAKQILLAACIGLGIGVERAARGKAASLHTFSVICTGSCLFTILSVEAAVNIGGVSFDPTRIAAQIVTGIGFLGAGVIFKTTGGVAGLTTGALIWLAAAIGMACGFNRIDLVIWTVGVGIAVYVLADILHQLIYVLRIRQAKRHRAERAHEAEAEAEVRRDAEQAGFGV